VSIAQLGLNPSIVNLIQDRTLERVFHDALFPRLLYRSEAMAEKWDANIGQRQVYTRTGLVSVDTNPLTPGSDPTPATYAIEQWEAECAQYGKSLDTHMPTSYVSLAPTFLRDTVQLGLNAGQTMNRLVRDRLFRAYLAGETVAISAALISATSIVVASLNGFNEILVNGRLLPVSPANPLSITFSAGPAANTVVGAAPLNPADPLGPGILTLGAPLSAALALRAGVRALTRSRITRVGGSATIDGITVANVLTLQDIINTVARMRSQNVPPTPDGFYHVHVTPEGEAQLFQDNAFQRLFQSLPENAVYRDLGIGQLVGCRFYRNVENPDDTNSGALVDTSGGSGFARESPEIGGEVINQSGVSIKRELVIGGGAVYEKYIDESQFLTDAGVTGKIGEFSVMNGGVAVMSERIRYILRAPLDRLQQIVSQSWSWSGDFPVPSDGLVGNSARYKRAAVIEHS
jgi:hypothetical protein